MALDAAKVLSNLLHQSPVVQTYCTTNGFLSKLLSRIKNHASLGISEHQIKVTFPNLNCLIVVLFLLRFMFGRYLTCGCCSCSRPCARTSETLPSTIMTVSWSSEKQSRCATNQSLNQSSLFYPQAILEGKATMDEPCLDSEECAVICEMLKVSDLKKLSP